MLLKILLIALIVYVIVVTRARVRLPHPGLQATVDVLQAATLRDEHVVATARRFVEYADAQQPALPAGDPYAERLERLTSRYAAVNGVPLNFRVYRTPQVNAFATADGSIRIYSGLMDCMSDDELMAVVGHEMGHIRNSDAQSLSDLGDPQHAGGRWRRDRRAQLVAMGRAGRAADLGRLFPEAGVCGRRFRLRFFAA